MSHHHHHHHIVLAARISLTLSRHSSLLHSHIIHMQPLHIYVRKHNDDTIKTSGHSSLEKYTSHFTRKGYCVRGELETEQRLQHIDPQLFWL